MKTARSLPPSAHKIYLPVHQASWPPAIIDALSTHISCWVSQLLQYRPLISYPIGLARHATVSGRTHWRDGFPPRRDGTTKVSMSGKFLLVMCLRVMGFPNFVRGFLQKTEYARFLLPLEAPPLAMYALTWMLIGD